jgi:hypothetical protein
MNAPSETLAARSSHYLRAVVLAPYPAEHPLHILRLSSSDILLVRDSCFPSAKQSRAHVPECRVSYVLFTFRTGLPVEASTASEADLADDLV